MYLGLTPFPISSRNSSAAIVHLVKKTGLLQIFVSSDPVMQRLISEAKELLRSEDGIDIEVLAMIRFHDISGHDTVASSSTDDILGDRHTKEELGAARIALDRLGIILHTSGASERESFIFCKYQPYIVHDTRYNFVPKAGVYYAQSATAMVHYSVYVSSHIYP